MLSLIRQETQRGALYTNKINRDALATFMRKLTLKTRLSLSQMRFFKPYKSCLRNIVFHVCLCFLLILYGANVPVFADLKQDLSLLETRYLGFTYPQDPSETRVSRLETTVFGSSTPNTAIDKRVQRLKKTLEIPKAEMPESFKKALEEQSQQQAETQDSRQANKPSEAKTKITLLPNNDELAEKMLKIINQERSFRSLRPLSRDSLASKVALEHASYLIHSRQLSHYGLAGKNPDQRYSEAGGTGKIDELVDGFFASVDEHGQIIPINIDSELPNQLMDAILKVPDKADQIFNRLSNGVGISFVLSPDKRQMVVVIEFVTNYAFLSQIPAKTSIAEGVSLTGSLNDGFRFAWIGVSMKPIDESDRSETEPSAYFPPIDQVVYLDKTIDRAKNIAKTGGMILAMVAAPFTYGASMIIADILMQTIAQTYQAQDVEVRQGIKVAVDGSSFSGFIPMGEWGPGVYYVTVWSIPPREKKPVVVSRRAIKVT